jgi:hypothetical protein
MSAEQLNRMSHNEICSWLERALREQEQLQRLTPDEPPYLGIVRLDKEVSPAVRNSLRSGVLNLLARFCENGLEEPRYLQELLSLASVFKQPETSEILGELALRFPEQPHVSLETKFSVLEVLVDISPPRTPTFWKQIFQQEPEHFALLAFSGTLASLPFEAVEMLPGMPNSKRDGEAAVINLEIAWDDLDVHLRSHFVQEVQNVLDRCRQNFANPIKTWIGSKVPSRILSNHSLLFEAITDFWKGAVFPTTYTPKLCTATPT